MAKTFVGVVQSKIILWHLWKVTTSKLKNWVDIPSYLPCYVGFVRSHPQVCSGVTPFYGIPRIEVNLDQIDEMK